ncbi:MAG: hypothetical protein ABR542_10850, partial [Desulfonatronovibrio sp.]
MKKIFERIKGPHLFLLMIFVVLGLMMLALSVRGYKEYSQQKIGSPETRGEGGSELTMEELRSMLDVSRDIPAGDIDVVARKNLFSPERTAWEPPPAKEDSEDQAPPRRHRINTSEFRLYGITSDGKQKRALIYYQRLPEKSRNRLVVEGEAVYQERHGGDEVFRLVSIDDKSVTLEASGENFEVGLFSHDRQQVNLSGSKIAVSIGGTGEEVTPQASVDSGQGFPPDPGASPRPASKQQSSG